MRNGVAIVGVLKIEDAKNQDFCGDVGKCRDDSELDYIDFNPYPKVSETDCKICMKSVQSCGVSYVEFVYQNRPTILVLLRNTCRWASSKILLIERECCTAWWLLLLGKFILDSIK